jgi:hypothetical protein
MRLLHGEPGCGKSTLALKFAWQAQGAFDRVVFQLCSRRPVAGIAAELAAKLKLGLETRPPEGPKSKSPSPRHGDSAGVGRYLGKRPDSARARSTGLVALHVTPALTAVDFTDPFVGVKSLSPWRGGVDFANLPRRGKPRLTLQVDCRRTRNG